MSAAETIIDWKVERLTNLLLLFVTGSGLSGSVINGFIYYTDPISCLIYKDDAGFVFLLFHI